LRSLDNDVSTISDIISSSPYFSTFDPGNEYRQVLFRPGFAVQSRELIEIQQIAADQQAKFGGAIYANGARITGGEVTSQNINYFTFQPTQGGVRTPTCTASSTPPN
jgi:hypothetical protein